MASSHDLPSDTLPKPHALLLPPLPTFARQDAQVSLLTAPLVRQGAQSDLFERKVEVTRKRSQDGETSIDVSPTRKSSNPKTPQRKTSSPRSKRPRQSSDPLTIWDEDKHHAKMLACHTIPELQRYYDLLLEKKQMRFNFGYEVQMKMVAKGRETHIDSPTRVKPFHFSVSDAFVQQRRQATADILAVKRSTTTANASQTTFGSIKSATTTSSSGVAPVSSSSTSITSTLPKSRDSVPSSALTLTTTTIPATVSATIVPAITITSVTTTSVTTAPATTATTTAASRRSVVDTSLPPVPVIIISSPSLDMRGLSSIGGIATTLSPCSLSPVSLSPYSCTSSPATADVSTPARVTPIPCALGTLPKTRAKPALPKRPPPARPKMPSRKPPSRPAKLSAADVALPATQPVLGASLLRHSVVERKTSVDGHHLSPRKSHTTNRLPLSPSNQQQKTCNVKTLPLSPASHNTVKPKAPLPVITRAQIYAQLTIRLEKENDENDENCLATPPSPNKTESKSPRRLHAC